MNADAPLLWLRDEPKPGERRAALTPSAVAQLLRSGLAVTVERSSGRVFADDDYRDVGAELVASGEWKNAPAGALIVGLKELDAGLGPFSHDHLHFAHVFKRQRGWDEVLRQFAAGDGRLYDLEYLVDERGQRVAAFGYWAGFVGAALGVLALAHERTAHCPLQGPLQAWSDRAALQSDVLAASDALRARGELPRALVFGALGRSGRGAVDLLEGCGIAVGAWDIDETRAGGPFAAVLEHELVVNCVFVAEPVPPFTTREALSDPERATAVLIDVSCDPFGEANVLPVYEVPTTLALPVRRLLPADALRPALDLIAIDHLPALLPRESSEDFAEQLLPTLLTLAQGGTLADGAFGRAAAIFERERAVAVRMTPDPAS